MLQQRTAMKEENDRLRSMVKLAAEMSTRLAAIRQNVEAIIHTEDDVVWEWRITSGVVMRETLMEIWMMTDPEYEGPPCTGHAENTTGNGSSDSASSSSSP